MIKTQTCKNKHLKVKIIINASNIKQLYYQVFFIIRIKKYF